MSLAPPTGIDLDCRVAGRAGDGRERMAVSHPYDGRIVGSVPLLAPEVIAEALDAGAAYRDTLTRHERAGILERVAARIAASADELAALITAESGLTLRDTHYEVRRATDVFRFAAMEALRDDGRVFACDTSVNGRPRRAYTTREPVRLVAAITPFNHPLNQVAHKVAPALAAGAPMVLKPSEKTPLAALWLAAAIDEAGLPAGALSIVTGDREAVLDAFLAHPAVDVVSFTGSVAVGKAIAARLGFRRAVLELGGNDPLIVLADADLDLATSLAATGAFANSGQRCTAVKRIIADARIADELSERLAERASGLQCGDPFLPDTDVGTVIDDEAADRIEARLEAARDAGARILTGRREGRASIAPAVLAGVRPEMELVREETFGPVAPILPADGLDAAIDLANATTFGLSAGVVTNDLGAAMQCIRRLRCGTVNVNEVPGYRTELTPFGGIGDSGLGVKEGVIEAMKAMSIEKLYTLPWPQIP
jgi:phosphonoacetaldehyde dehydrogenase